MYIEWRSMRISKVLLETVKRHVKKGYVNKGKYLSVVKWVAMAIEEKLNRDMEKNK